ncbi:glycosyltransferase [Alcaligenes endophyticus]|uniref:Glycosyltransferase n=1 Tax=Alcaligenes endophyticus TaxID=1929088 RepID=A0ABT8EG54_9BURK|nr:glycosyltransferase [Alcaligenes endophyticus]MCX5590212.1 glycosyltransferase [Alcaligenes endophyticus]MDN4120125.1 glycosyltransferase [Alcaligenes endophyticus]
MLDYIFISGSHNIFGGGQVYIRDLNKKLNSLGYESCIIASDTIFSNSIKIPRIDTWSLKFKNICKIIKLLRKIDPQKNAKIITNDITLSMLSIIIRISGWKVHPIIHMSLANTSSTSIFIKYSYPLIRALLINIGSSSILSVNKENDKYFLRKSNYIGNFTSYTPDLIENLKTLDFLYVGRFDIEKQPLEFIKILNNLKNNGLYFKSAMIGTGCLWNEAKKLISEFELNDYIELTGFLNQDEIIDYYKKSKLLFITSRTEGLPTVILDAATFGTNFISPALGSIKYINSKFGVGYVIPLSEMSSFILKNHKELIFNSQEIIDLSRHTHIDRVVNNFIDLTLK